MPAGGRGGLHGNRLGRGPDRRVLRRRAVPRSRTCIIAVASPASGNLLYPGGNGDVVVTIANPNPFPVTISAVNLPTTTTYASGYTTSALGTTQTGCIATTPSGVAWNFATAPSGSSHTLQTALTVASGA